MIDFKNESVNRISTFNISIFKYLECVSFYTPKVNIFAGWGFKKQPVRFFLCA